MGAVVKKRALDPVWVLRPFIIEVFLGAIVRAMVVCLTVSCIAMIISEVVLLSHVQRVAMYGNMHYMGQREDTQGLSFCGLA